MANRCGHGYFSCLLVALLIALVWCACTSTADTAAQRPSATPRNIIQACTGQLEDTCDDRQADRVNCLVENFQRVDSAVCREWLSARAVCLSFVTRRAKDSDEACTVREYRRCLRKTPKEQLPAACRASDYYKSLFIHKPRKFATDNGDL